MYGSFEPGYWVFRNGEISNRIVCNGEVIIKETIVYATMYGGNHDRKVVNPWLNDGMEKVILVWYVKAVAVGEKVIGVGNILTI